MASAAARSTGVITLAGLHEHSRRAAVPLARWLGAQCIQHLKGGRSRRPGASMASTIASPLSKKDQQHPQSARRNHFVGGSAWRISIVRHVESNPLTPA
jgi:hypothetical protein